MARYRLRYAFFVAAASSTAFACSFLTPFDDLSRDFGHDDGGPPDATSESAPVDGGSDAVADSACPERFLPAEGTYEYWPYLAGDILKLNDAAVPTAKTKAPFFADVIHGPVPGCWTFHAKMANDEAGFHDHTWTFCNTCRDGVAALDVTAEDDDFYVAALGEAGHEKSHYTCGTPNPFYLPDATIDASIPQSVCSGTGTGGSPITITITPIEYVYEGRQTLDYFAADGSIDVDVFHQQLRLIVAGGGGATNNIHRWYFDPVTGLPEEALLLTDTKTLNGTVDYTWSFVMLRGNGNVAPLNDP